MSVFPWLEYAVCAGFRANTRSFCPRPIPAGPPNLPQELPCSLVQQLLWRIYLTAVPNKVMIRFSPRLGNTVPQFCGHQLRAACLRWRQSKRDAVILSVRPPTQFGIPCKVLPENNVAFV